MNKNKAYDFDLIYEELQNNTQLELILKMLYIQFIRKNQNSFTSEEVLVHCKKLYHLDCEQYERLYLKLWKDQFQLSPHNVSCYQQFQKLPKHGNIQLYDFNISLSEMSIDEQTHLIENWILQMNDQQLFKCLIPIFFDIIKRGEDSKFFISIINKQLKVKKMDFFFKNGFNMKALFQILYNNSDYELQVMLLKFHCKFNPIPFLYKNLDFDNIKDQDEVYKLNEKLFYIIPDCLTIINFSLNSKQKSFGKTMLINQIFYQMNKFEICDKCEINNSTIDIMFDYSFSGSRQFAIADTHGIIPESMLLKILPFFQIWIIQMNSEKELIETYENLKKLISSLNNLQNSPKFCLVIRNSTESIDKLKSNQKYHEIFKFTQQIHCVQNLTQQDITKNQYDDELEEFQKFIFEIISQASFGNRIQNQNAFLEIIKKFNYENIQLQKQREDEIIINLEKQLKVLIDKPDGFYNKDSFPLRALDYQILKLNEEKNNLQQQNQINNSIKINQIQKEITQLENSIKDLQFTDILNLFCDIFSRNNSYILYLSFVEKLRIFNEVNSNLIQDQVQSLNEKLQILKKNRKALRQNDQQIVEQDDQSKKLKEEIKQIDEELKEQLKRISERNIGIELFWREVISIQNKSVFKKKQINPVDVVYELIKKGEPFEFLDGDQLKIDQQFLKQLIYKFSKQGEEKVLVLSVLGPQSSGKSMILNKIFGCHFWTSVGRCTKGIYLQLLKIQQKNQFDNLFDYILLLDTEGLQNPNQKDPEFDKKIALFVLSISDITLINVKGDIHQQFKNLVEMCIFTFGQMKSVISANKQLSWCFNQNNDVNNFAPFLDQLQGIASNLNIEFSQTEQESESQNIDYNEILDIKKENIQILGFASTERSWQNTSLGMKQNWRQLIINETFCQEAYQYGIRLIKNFVSKIKQLGNDDNSISSLHSFIQNIETHWQSICRLPDLLEFTELKQYKQDELMKNSLDQNYKSQNFYFIENLPHEIQNHLNQQKEKNLSTFQQFQMLKEKEVIAQFDQIKTQIKELLFKIKQEQKISKKIFIKYQNRLTQKIQSQIEECKVTIYSQVKNHETKFQEIKGFSQNEKFVSDISANPQELKQLQKYPNEIEDKFKNKWEQIINDYNQQILNIFNEYSKKQYTSISYSFDQYRLQTKREQEIQDKFINDINKNSLFNNQNNEKNKIFNIFREELKEQQFILLDSTKNITVYGDIFSQPIIEKLKKAKETDLININNFYKVQLEYYIIKKVELEKYLNKGGLYFDFSQKYRIYEQQRQNLKSYIFKFLLIINQFRLIFNQTYYDDLIKAIDIPRKVYESSKSYDQIVLKLFENLSQTFIVPADKIVLNNQEFFQSLKLNYGYLYYVQYKIELNNFNECQQFLQKKIQDDEILLYHSNKIIPKDNQNQSLEYIANQNCKYQKKAFSNSFVEFFSKQMMEKKGWEKLYFQLYDIIYQEMRSNYQIIYKNSQMDSDQELGSANCKLIQIIMSKIKSQIQQFNKQFAIFGITLSDIGERCIYYYSMILIWRFSCYQKWKTLEEGHNNLQKLYPIQFEKFKAQILQNKVQQSSIKAKSLSDAIYQAYINYFYFDNQIKVKNLIKAKIINCYQIIKELDRKLLENYNKNLDENMKIEIFNYITDQKNFIENQVKIQIKQIQEQLKQDFQQQLRDGLTNYLLILKSNIEIILNNIQNQQMYGNKVNEFFESHEQDSRKDLEFEQMMFKLIQPCIFGVQEQNPILNKIKRKFQGIFYHEQYRSIFPQLNLLVLKQEEEIQQLKPYIQQLLTEFNENLRKCQNEILRIDIFDINSEFDEMKLNMIGCIESCPFCNRKCDEPNDNNHRHKCKNGHQLGGMNYVLLKDKPSLLICEEIKDDQILKTQDSTIFRTWKDMKKMYKEWDFDLLTNLEDKDKIKNKMMNVWNGGIGLLVCNFLTQKYGKKIQFINKNEFELTNIHYIIVLDDSQSMQGTRFENAKQGCLNCMKNMQKNPSARISLIIFNSKARVQIDCQQVNIRDQSNKFTYQNGGTNFENAFIEVYNLILKHQNQKFNKHVILFYTDGEAAYPKNAINKFIALSQEQKQAISLYTCTLDNSPITLQLMIQELKNNGFKAKLQKNIEVNQIQSVWTEIIQKGIHVKE
ncbi:unnamed protein product [Paramecium sonneborni]|uniref:VLIG-type G domain-containing protein n=1 Tax=Paramecium sonneborni TaxID=65129 RepID=A0A8S1PXF2_9CILI|nr:unnamed protein product [Paramecium sonneborni]